MNDKPPGGSNNVPGIGVGFMPQVDIHKYDLLITTNRLQDLSLYRELNLKEALSYFGKMYGLTRDEMKSRIKLMVEFLDLPDTNRRIDEMRY